MRKRTLLLGISILGSYGGIMMASPNDCGIVSKIQDVTKIANNQSQSPASMQGIITLHYKDFESVLPTEALGKALENLKKYCCQSNGTGDNTCTAYQGNQKQNYPQSPYLYDQLIDVSLRRLDAIPEFAYGLSGDPTAVKWRSFISDAATASPAPQAKTIAENYQKYWTRTPYALTEASTMTQIKTFLQSYNTPTISLADKYYSICKVMEEAYYTIANEKIIIGDSQDPESAYSACQDIVNQRIQKEYVYTKSILLKTSNETLHTVHQKYTMTYFLQEKLAGLIDLISSIQSLFSTMVHQAAASKSCSK